MTNQIRLSLFSAVIGATFAVAPHVAVADTFEWKGAGSTFLAGLSTNYINGASVAEGVLQRLDNSDKKYLPMISGEDLLFRLKRPDGTYDYIHVFTNTTGRTLSLQTGYVVKNASVLLIGGGGGGGLGKGGGGGGGGFREGTIPRIDSGDYPISVGVGGSAGVSNGSNDGGPGGISSIVGKDGANVKCVLATAETVDCLVHGGGFGAYGHGGKSGDGASGGGAGCSKPDPGFAGKGIPGEGFDGGQILRGDPGYNDYGYSSGAGGGGAGGKGNLTAGGAGLSSAILGFESVFAKGGRGGLYPNGNEEGARGACGSGNGGGGGGGNVNFGFGPGGRGGDGIVIVRYSGEPKPTGFFIHIR